ncbi:MAG: LUD domain-containing protein [Edaphobacter sp.]|uniref:LutC/YkgG family protein n=1 Tax=Edaphobacter sp. TaxID=1934404 RepID=UPI0023A0EBA7|nr:LUD domain-containing protein [Edaphobacter sp.]MDE1176447.1 LUD domain-containing protein [Edaphobacter sp.]
MSTAREEILRRVRAAKGASTLETAAASYAGIDRSYQTTATLSHEAILDLFEERLREYDANVFRVSALEVGAAVTEVLRSRKIERVLIPEGLPEDWQRGAEFVVDREFSATELDGFTAVMTTATVGIAETGTIVLQTAPGQGRRAITLVPDYHLCLLPVISVVETVVEAMRLLELTKNLPTTFFSGPSATADIEMTRIKGVHGPRFVDVILMN